MIKCSLDSLLVLLVLRKKYAFEVVLEAFALLRLEIGGIIRHVNEGIPYVWLGPDLGPKQGF